MFANNKSSLLQSVAGAILGVTMLLLLRRYPGISHDAILYMGQGLMQRWPEIYGQDLFFVHGSQISYTILPWITGKLFQWLAPSTVFMYGAFASMLLFAFSSWTLLRTVLPEQQRYWAWLGTLCLPPFYGVVSIFSYNEPFLTSRPIAESLCLLSISFLVRKKWLFATIFMASAALFHPLQAIAACATIYAWLILRDHRWMHGAWLIIPIAALAIVNIAPFNALIQRTDDAWFKELTYSKQLFVTLWDTRDFKAMGFDVFALICGWKLLSGEYSRWCLAAALGATLGLLGSLLLSDTLHLTLPIGLQLWRTLWLTHFFAAATLVALLFHHYREKQHVHILLLTLAALLTWGDSGIGCIVLVAMYICWSIAPKPSLLRLEKIVFWIILAAITLLFINYASSVIHPTGIEGIQITLTQSIHRLIVFPALALGIPITATFAWNSSIRTGQHSSPQRPLILVALLLPFTAISVYSWDNRSQTQRSIEGLQNHPAIFGSTLPESAQIYWEPESLLASWLILNRASFYTDAQLSGQMFNRATFSDGLARQKRVLPLMLESRQCFTEHKKKNLDPFTHCKINHATLKNVCANGGPDYLALPYLQAEQHAGMWTLRNHASHETIAQYWLYDCKMIRQLQ